MDDGRCPADPAAWLARLFHVVGLTGGRVFFAGNGGSACNADHMAEDLAGCVAPRGDFGKPDAFRVSAISLCSNVGLLTAIANDQGYCRVFDGQLWTHRATPHDLVVLLSTSGESFNVVRAAEWCRDNNVPVAAMTGPADSPLARRAAFVYRAESAECGAAESEHLAVFHRALLRLREMARPI
jgi:phosphoheptose isomerase